MKYFFRNGDYAGDGINDCKIAICEGQKAVSYAKEWKTVGKKIEFIAYGIDKQERLLLEAVRDCADVSPQEREIFVKVLKKVCGVRKCSLNAKEVMGVKDE